jgi:hypothetical protein
MTTIISEKLNRKISAVTEIIPDEIDLDMITEFENDSSDEYVEWEDYKKRRDDRTHQSKWRAG